MNSAAIVSRRVQSWPTNAFALRRSTPLPVGPQSVVLYRHEDCGATQGVAVPRGDDSSADCRPNRHVSEYLCESRERPPGERRDARPDLAVDARVVRANPLLMGKRSEHCLHIPERDEGAGDQTRSNKPGRFIFRPFATRSILTKEMLRTPRSIPL